MAGEIIKGRIQSCNICTLSGIMRRRVAANRVHVSACAG